MNSDLSGPKFTAWVEAEQPMLTPIGQIEKFAGGQSNPTYRVGTAQGDMVLRRKPSGELLASAHAVDREYRLIAALHPIGFPVPRPVALCQDRAVIGAEFYLMEAIEGQIHWDGQLRDQDVAARRSIYEAAIGTLATLHSIDPTAVGLADFGRPGNYFARQVDRWTRQYRAARPAPVKEVEWLIDWLPRTVPEQTRTCIVHGDFRIDNMLFARRSAAVLAVIDWELSTIGDPLADLSYFMMAWTMPSQWHSAWFGEADIAGSGIPSLEDAVGIYCEQTRRAAMPDLDWYFAFNLFRMIGITEGIRRRIVDGNASSANASAAVTPVAPMARQAWAHARKAGAPRQAV